LQKGSTDDGISNEIMTVYLLEHAYERTPDSEAQIKTIGIYATRVDAEAAIGRLSKQPGFRDFPDHFVIDPYELGQDSWQEGFFTDVHTPVWEVWEKDSGGMLTRVGNGMTENEALQFVRDRENKTPDTYFAKERR
jgi:hypothetical protein